MASRSLALLALVVSLLAALPTSAAIINVTTGADSGAGSLRAAINAANSGAGDDTIRFNAGLAGSTIHLLTELPTLTDNATTIDGDINDDGRPDIALSGDKAPVGSGIQVTGANCLIQGLCINYCSYGIYIHDATAHDNRVESCYIGTNLAGTSPLPNESYGIYVYYAPKNTIGGAAATTRNVVSGNFSYGIYAYRANGLKVYNLYCGLNAAGTGVIGNHNGGVYIYLCAGAEVGTPVDTADTVISGNFGNGVSVNYSRLFKLRNTYVGTNAAGSLPRPNNSGGVYLYACNNATVGGTTALTANVLSGNAGSGLQASYSGEGLLVQGNRIGTNPAGNSAVPNASSGVSLSNCSGSTIGGGVTAARNIISANSDDAIYLTRCFSTTVKGNFLGVSAGGSGDLRNQGDGVEAYQCVTVNVGDTAADRNVIVCDGAGVRFSGNQGSANSALNNYIGYGANGTTALPCGTGVNVSYGVRTALIGQAGKGNRILATGEGVYFYKAGSGCAATENRIGAPVGTTAYGNTGLSVNYCAPLLNDNQVFQQSSQGLYAYGPQMTSIVEGNTFRRGASYGVQIASGAQPNLGDLTSPSAADNGGNTFTGNKNFDIYNGSTLDIKAEGNTFASTKAEVIDARFIYDELDDLNLGRVDYAPLSSGAPTSAGGGVALTSVAAVPTALGAQVVVTLAAEGELQAEVLNLAGRAVRALPPTAGRVGVNTLLWDRRSNSGTAAPSGAYLISVTCRTPDGRQQRQVARLYLNR